MKQFVRNFLLTFSAVYILSVPAVADSTSSKLDSLEKYASTLQNADSIAMVYDTIVKSLPGNDYSGIGEQYLNLANLMMTRGNPKYSLEAANSALDKFAKAHDSLNILRSKNKISLSYMKMGKYDTTAVLFKEIIESFIRNKIERLLKIPVPEISKDDSSYLEVYSIALRNFALTLKSLKHKDKAFYYFDEHLRIEKYFNNRRRLLGAYLNGGNFASDNGDSILALRYFSEAETLALELDFKPPLPFIYVNKAKVLIESFKDYEAASQYSLKALNEFDTAKPILNKQLYYHCLVFYAISEFYLGHDDIAMPAFFKVRDYIPESPAPDHFNTAYKYMGLGFAKAGKYHNMDSALYYSDKFEALYKESFLNKQNEAIAEFEVEMETERAKRTADKAMLLAERRNDRIILLTFCILGFIILTGFLLKMIKDKNRRNRELKMLYDTKDKFISLLAHDIRSPLATALSSIRLIREYGDNLTSEQKEIMLTEVDKSCCSLIDMLEDVLKWMQVSTKKLEPQKEEIILSDTIGKTLDIMKATYNQKNIELDIQIDEKIKVRADKGILNTATRNFLQNAVKFSYEGTKVTLKAEATPNEKIKISVIDNGIGMSREILDELNSDNVKSRKGTKGEIGTGFGLQMCKEFLEAHDSQLRFESEEGKGTVVSFELQKA
jgi:signal transduction histidine kinase